MSLLLAKLSSFLPYMVIALLFLSLVNFILLLLFFIKISKKTGKILDMVNTVKNRIDGIKRNSGSTNPSSQPRVGDVSSRKKVNMKPIDWEY